MKRSGAPVPDGATAVVMVEDTELVEGRSDLVKINKGSSEGQDIREIGSDLPKGDLVLEKVAVG